MGGVAEIPPAGPAAAARNRAARREAEQAQRMALDPGGEGVELPDDVDLEEQRMLMAALTGEAYVGRIPDFDSDPRYRPRALSPGAAQREQLRLEQDAAYHESLAADRRKAEAAEAEARAAADAEAAARGEAERQRCAREDAAAAAAAEAEAAASRLRAKTAALPPEPEAGAADAVMVVVRMPGGGRLSRRFRQGDSLESLFNFVDGAGQGGEVPPGRYNLVSQYPRRVFADVGSRKTLAEADLAQKQEALFIEMKD